MNSKTLKKHLKYIVPEMRLALIKEPGANPLPINCPDDLKKFVEPLRHYADFVPKLNMCLRCRQGELRLAEPACCGT